METDVPFSVIAGTDVVPSLLGHFSLSAARPRLHVCHTEHPAMSTRIATRTAGSAFRSSLKQTRSFHSTLRRDEIFRKVDAEVYSQLSPRAPQVDSTFDIVHPR